MCISKIFFKYGKRSLFILSSVSLVISCRREMMPASQKEATALSAELVGRAASMNPLSGIPANLAIQSAVVTTIAGTGGQGDNNGPGNVATFLSPVAVASDAAGNIYIADAGNNLIRKMTPAGVISNFAGNGTAGFADGPVQSASFKGPTGVAVGTDGSVYVADQSNNRIRKISGGVVSTLAGTGVAGFADGAGNLAKFNGPFGLAVDGAGTVYVADEYNNMIRRISPAGVVTRWCGQVTAGFTDAAGANAQFNGPVEVAVAPNGVVYVTDAFNQRIRKITSGVVTTLAGNGTASETDGTGTAATFSNPVGINVDGNGNLYVTDYIGETIRKVTSAGVVTTIAGGTAGFLDSYDNKAKFAFPYGIVIDPTGNIYVADALNQRIRKITFQAAIRTLAGNDSVGYVEGRGRAAKFYFPRSVAVNAAGTVYVADMDNHRIRQIAPDGTTSLLAGSGNFTYAEGTGAGASFNTPTSVALDAAGNVYVVDAENFRIRKITPAGVTSLVAGTGVSGFSDANGVALNAQFFSPSALALDAAGNIYVTDYDRVRKITPAGVISSLPRIAEIPPQPASEAGIESIAVAADGTIYVGADQHGKVWKIVGGNVSVFTTDPNTGFFGPHLRPYGLAVDQPTGNVYVSGYGDNQVGKFNSSGTLLGTYGTNAPGFLDGPVASAQLFTPGGLAVGANGILYIDDYQNMSIRMTLK